MATYSGGSRIFLRGTLTDICIKCIKCVIPHAKKQQQSLLKYKKILLALMKCGVLKVTHFLCTCPLKSLKSIKHNFESILPWKH